MASLAVLLLFLLFLLFSSSLAVLSQFLHRMIRRISHFPLMDYGSSSTLLFIQVLLQYVLSEIHNYGRISHLWIILCRILYRLLLLSVPEACFSDLLSVSDFLELFHINRQTFLLKVLLLNYTVLIFSSQESIAEEHLTISTLSFAAFDTFFPIASTAFVALVTCSRHLNLTDFEVGASCSIALQGKAKTGYPRVSRGSFFIRLRIFSVLLCTFFIYSFSFFQNIDRRIHIPVHPVSTFA